MAGGAPGPGFDARQQKSILDNLVHHRTTGYRIRIQYGTGLELSPTIMDRKIWAFSQKMSWLFWLFWLFLYLSLGKMAFSSWLFWLFAQKARLFWLFAKLGYIVVAFVDVYKLIYHFFHYKVLFTSIFWLFPGFCKKTVCSAR